jgi:hypothetical protein
MEQTRDAFGRGSGAQVTKGRIVGGARGRCVDIGRDMETAHAGMHISEADWSAAVKDLNLTRWVFSVPACSRTCSSAIPALKLDIVGAP